MKGLDFAAIVLLRLAVENKLDMPIEERYPNPLDVDMASCQYSPDTGYEAMVIVRNGSIEAFVHRTEANRKA